MQKNQTNEHLLEEPLLETYKRSCILIGINISDAAAAAVSVFVCVCVCDEEGNQKQRCGLSSSTEVGACSLSSV